MATTEILRNETSEAAIFARFWESPKHGLTRALATIKVCEEPCKSPRSSLQD